MIFWIAAVALGTLVALGLVIPLLRSRADAADRAEYDVNVYKDQLKELEREAEQGRISGAELDAARVEIQRRLLAAAEDAKKPRTASTASKNLPVLAAIIVTPLLALVFYTETGSPNLPGFPLAERADVKPPATTPDGRPSMNAMVAQLEERLRQSPNDGEGWMMLGRSYASIGNPRNAAAAYQRAIKLIGREPALLADWAEARLMSRDGEFTPEIFADFLEVRERDPLQPKPWFYIGLDKAMGGDLEGAAQTWVDLLAISPSDAEYANSVREQIARAATDGGFPIESIQPSETARAIAEGRGMSIRPEAQASGGSDAPGPTQEQVRDAQEMTAEERQAFIRSMVDRLASKLEENPNDPAGWERLIRAYEVLGETEKMNAAKEKLKALQGN